MKVLLLYPKYPDSFWSFKHALRFISKKAAVPPLGLITVSAMMPENWEKKLVDLNITKLRTEDILWADFVMISAMYIQKESVIEIVDECKKHKVKIIAGGPLFTQEYLNYPDIDVFILNEAELTLPNFLDDLDKGNQLKKIYFTDEFADLRESPVPDYHLLSQKDYVYMNVQVSRGCPFACDFCEITSLLGHKVRMKDSVQVLHELDTIYKLNWRGPVAIVDDNFIGNKKVIKNELLPALKQWMITHAYPFSFNTQMSINIADDEELLSMMVEAGFDSTFIGIETPNEESLKHCNKVQNQNRNLLMNVRKIQKMGMAVSGGFIVGFDSDLPTVFQRQIDFIQQSGIVSAMVGLLNAPKHTKLYDKLKTENRLTVEASGNNTDSSMNFIPKMNMGELLTGYKKIIFDIYSSKPYYQRIRQFLTHYRKPEIAKKRIQLSYLIAFLKSMLIIGILNKGRAEYWKFLIWTLFNKPNLFTDAVTYAVYGYHFRTIFGLRKNNPESN